MALLKNYMIQRLWRANEHEENYKDLIPRTHRIEGWSELTEYTGHCVESIRRFMKLEGFPKPTFHYRPKTDRSSNRPGDPTIRVNVWRKTAMWDKREVGDWFKGREV